MLPLAQPSPEVMSGSNVRITTESGSGEGCGRQESSQRALSMRRERERPASRRALHALRYHRERLTEDHRRAKRLAEGLAGIQGFAIHPEDVDTNIVVVGLTKEGPEPRLWSAKLAEQGILVVPFGERGLRLVTHLDVSDADIDEALRALEVTSKELFKVG